MQASIIPYLSQARINWEGCGRKSIGVKIGYDESGGTVSSDGVAFTRTIAASASIFVPCTIKLRMMMARNDQDSCERGNVSLVPAYR